LSVIIIDYYDVLGICSFLHPFLKVRMPQKLHWSEAADTILRRLRAEGEIWDSIAATLGVSRWTAIERGRRIGARRPPPEFVPKPDLARGPLRAGHPLSWGLLTRGTRLQGEPYPGPESSERDRAG